MYSYWKRRLASWSNRYSIFKNNGKYYKPSILICFEGEDSKGSGRSIQGFDLHEAAVKCSKHLKAYGGHSMAIGLSLKTNEFEDFKQEFEEYSKDKITADMVPELIIDEVVERKI